MTPAAFAYLRPNSLPEALAALSEHGDEASLLAGGQSLVPMMMLRMARPGVVIDLGGLRGEAGLDGLAAAEGAIRLGALTRHRWLEQDPQVARHVPALAHAAGWVATPAIRNAGTLGGALALADAAAEYPAVVLALAGHLHLASARGTRRVAAEDFFLGPMQTDAAPEEMLLALEIAADAATGFGFCEIAERRGDYALAGAVVVRGPGLPGGVRVAVFGATEATCLAPDAARLLAEAPPGDWSDARLDAVAAAARAELADLALDPWRLRQAGVAVRRAAQDLAARAAPGGVS